MSTDGPAEVCDHGRSLLIECQACETWVMGQAAEAAAERQRNRDLAAAREAALLCDPQAFFDAVFAFFGSPEAAAHALVCEDCDPTGCGCCSYQCDRADSILHST